MLEIKLLCYSGGGWSRDLAPLPRPQRGNGEPKPPQVTGLVLLYKMKIKLCAKQKV